MALSVCGISETQRSFAPAKIRQVVLRCVATRKATHYSSKALPVGTSYWCPLPNWKHREHHVVIRSGVDGLGVWRSERRDLYADARAYLGSNPGDVTRVWLIAVSLFNREPGACAYADIRLRSGGEVLTVL